METSRFQLYRILPSNSVEVEDLRQCSTKNRIGFNEIHKYILIREPLICEVRTFHLYQIDIRHGRKQKSLFKHKCERCD